jgi:hypothetical protein
MASPLPFIKRESTAVRLSGVSYAASSTGESEDSEGGNLPYSRPQLAARQQSTIVPIMNLGTAELRLKTPLYVNIEQSDGHVVSLSYDLELAEQGETEFEALDALREAIVEFFIAVREMGDDAPLDLKRRFEFLQSLAF